MERDTITDLLKTRPGYEIVYLLLQSDQRQKDLAAYVDQDGGTLHRWLAEAEQEGLISRDTYLRDNDKYVEYSLACTIPSDLISIIEDRGGNGPRDTRSNFADTAGCHVWTDPHSL